MYLCTALWSQLRTSPHPALPVPPPSSPSAIQAPGLLELALSKFSVLIASFGIKMCQCLILSHSFGLYRILLSCTPYAIQAPGPLELAISTFCVLDLWLRSKNVPLGTFFRVVGLCRFELQTSTMSR
jgi:hypothetical protein